MVSGLHKTAIELPRSGFWAFLLLVPLTLGALADQKPQKPVGNPGTVVRDIPLYVGADEGSAKLTTVVPGREIMIAERSGKWLRVFANTDVEEAHSEDTPVFGQEATPPPISGWIQDKGVISAATPQGDSVLFGIASSMEDQASEPHPPARAAQEAMLLYRRVADIFPQSPFAGEAAWRAADISWQLQKADVFSRPSAHEKENYLRQQIDEDQMKKIEKRYPGTKWADLAAYDMIDNKICGDWQGSEKCPEKETEIYLKYVADHPNSPKAPEALYKAVWRQASVADMYASDNEDKKADDARAHAKDLAARLESKYPQSDYSARAAGLIYKLEQGIPIYGIDRE